ncbi:hypothetical protein M9H77_22628 [Catharanthus roseus]|uniref:Uncharacterized protein n=1 Tax=Catharanthus roseus TaxID=4058 RepID=A0ACC0ASP4_CATRO|nr:hypothetical protein M9H77_22628 [Catharanthus roseus]
MASDQNFHSFNFSELLGVSVDKSQVMGTFLLFFIFFFAFFLLFFLYICIQRREIITNGTWLPTRAISWTRTAIGLDDATIGGLPTFSYEPSGKNGTNNKSIEETECCICLSIFEEGDKVKVLPKYSHGFHSESVDKWLRNRSNCPLCRTPVIQDSSEISAAGEA